MFPLFRANRRRVALAFLVASGCTPAVVPPRAAAPVSTQAPAPPPTAAPTDPVRAEADRRQETLLEQGFNLTHGWTLRPSDPNPIDLELVVPPPGEEHIF